MRILSIDVGVKNCAFYIEEFDERKLTAENFYTAGTRKYWKLVNFQGGDVFVKMTAFLDSNRRHFDACNGIIIEKQLKVNYSAQIVQHFLTSYFRVLYGPFKYISDISATRKTQVLHAPASFVG